MNADTAIELGKLVLAFGRVERATFHEDGIRPETDTDHTVMLGIIACELVVSMRSQNDDPAYTETTVERLDIGLVAQYALVHDLVEALAGDTNSFDISAEAKAAKDKREEQAFEELYERFDKTCPWLCQRLAEYEAQEYLEARFVRYLDKAMPKITHTLNACAAIKRMGKTGGELVMAHDKQLHKLGAQYPEFAGTVVEQLQEALMKKSEHAYRSVERRCSICKASMRFLVTILLDGGVETACGACIQEVVNEGEIAANHRRS